MLQTDFQPLAFLDLHGWSILKSASLFHSWPIMQSDKEKWSMQANQTNMQVISLFNNTK